MLKRPLSLARFRSHASRSGWAMSDALVGPALLLLLSPFLLHRLGAAGFGLWALATAISGFGALASFGVGIATTKYVSEDLGAKNPQAALAVTRSAMTVALIGGGTLIALIGLAAPGLASLAFGKMGDRDTVSVALTLGAVLLMLQEVDGVFAGALRGAHRFDAVAKIEMVMRPLWALAVALTAWRTGDTNATLLASVVFNALKAAAKAVSASRVLHGVCVALSFDRNQFARVIHFGKWAWLQGLGIVFFSVLDRMLVGALLGAGDLARYSICLQLTQFVHGIQGAALQPIVPWVSGSPIDTHRMFRLKRLSLIGGAACLVIPLLGALASPWILSLWISPAFAAANQGLVLGLFASAAVLSFGVPVHYMLIGLGEIWLIGVTTVVGGLLNLGTALLFSAIGVGAFAIGRMVFAALTLLFFFRLWQLAKRQLRSDLSASAPVIPAASA